MQFETTALPRAAIAAPPPGRDVPYVPLAQLPASSEAASRPLLLVLPTRPREIIAGLTRSARAGGHTTQGGGETAVASMYGTSDPYSPHRAAALDASGGGAGVPEPRPVAGVHCITARAIEARTIRATKKKHRDPTYKYGTARTSK